MAKKTWIEKRDCDKSYKIKTIDKKFADIPEGSKMFISTPKIIDDYIKHIPFGKSTELSTMRNDLAIEYQACLLYTSPSPRDRTRSRMPSSA